MKRRDGWESIGWPPDLEDDIAHRIPVDTAWRGVK